MNTAGEPNHGGVMPAGAAGGAGGSGASGSADAGGPGASGSAGAGGSPGVPRGCPDASWGRCDSGVDITLRLDGVSKTDTGAWAEPLQVPTYPPFMVPPPEPMHVPPEAWDRSQLPAGACVFRIHGVPPDCLGREGRVSLNACDPGGPPPPLPLGYYELNNCEQGIAPGCPSDDAYAGENYIWYAVPDAESPDTTKLVVCAGLCKTVTEYSMAVCVHRAPRP